jgi:hypothetical protein
MNRPSAGQAAALGGASIGAAAIAIGVAQIELSGQAQPHIWSNGWLLLALVLAGTGLLLAVVFFVMSLFSREESKPAGPVASNEHLRTKQDGQTSEQGIDQTRLKAAEPGGAEAAAGTGHPQQEQGEPADHDSFAAAMEELGLSEYMVLPGSMRPRSGPAFTECWRHTSNGFEASALMRMTSLSMPGFNSARGQSPQIRLGACIAGNPIPSGASSSVFGAKLMDLLRRDPVASLINSVINISDGLAWTRQAGNGVLSLEAVLSPTGQDGEPVASALLQPPVKGMRLYGRDEGIACLWLHLDPGGIGDSVAQGAGLADWYQRFKLVIAVARAFADFLADDLGSQTLDDPAARAGVMIETVGPISGLVDTGDLAPLPGAIAATQFLGYAIADPQGGPADQVAHDLLRQFCDHTLHLGDFEGVLESIRANDGAASQPATRPPQAVQNTWETRELPVLRAVVKLLDQPGSFEASVSQISDETGIDKADVDRAIEALKGEYVTEYQQFLTGGDPSTWAVRGITSGARRAVGQWPSG